MTKQNELTWERAEQFDITEGQLHSLYIEIGELSKKKPDGPISKFKLKFMVLRHSLWVAE